MTGTTSPKLQLASAGLAPKKGFGQNFLVDARLAARIAEQATTPSGGSVVEIGAGLGALTRPLLARAAHVTAIERDRDLVPLLRAEFADDIASEQLTILEADAKAVDIAAEFTGRPRPHVLAGNLPYQITGPLLSRTIELAGQLDRAVLLVQLEVADRLCAAPDGEAYGALSVFTQAAFTPTRAFVLRRGAFYPQPNVDSALVVLVPHRPRLAQESPGFRDVVRAAFSQRRKKLRNAWSTLAEAERLASAAARAGVDLDARGETLDVGAFARMAVELSA